MFTEYLNDLLQEVEKRGGGLVLNSGEKPAAVVLSVEKYNQLLGGGVEWAYNSANLDLNIESSKKILVTGGAGYVGGHVVRDLMLRGFEVVILDNLSTGKVEHVPAAATFVEGNILDINLLRDVFSQNKIGAVIHLAASLEVGESMEKPVEYFENNVVATSTLLKVMHEAGVKDIVFSSTAAVYGPQATVPIPETAPCRPTSPYGYSKLLAEGVLKYYTEFCGFSATVFRFFNVCGSRPEWNVGDTHKNSHLIPVVLEVASGVREKIVINGHDYETFDGTPVRDYIHVADIARAHSLAVEKPQEASSFRVYNVGTSKGLSVTEIITGAAEVTGKMIPMEFGPRRSGDDAVTVAECMKIKSELGFTPEFSSLENIIRTSWEQLSKEKTAN